MGGGQSTPETGKTYVEFFKDLDKRQYSKVSGPNKYLNFLTCVNITSMEKDLKKILPSYMHVDKRTIDIGEGNITYYDQKTKEKILGDVCKYTKGIKDKFKIEEGTDIDIKQYTLTKGQVNELEDKIRDIIVGKGEIAGPIYVAYAKRMVYDGTYIERHARNMGDEQDGFYQLLLSELRNPNNEERLKSSIFARYRWKGQVDVIIMFPNMNNVGNKNRLHTNIYDFKLNNYFMKVMANEVSEIEINNIRSMNPFKAKGSILQGFPDSAFRKILEKVSAMMDKKNNFERDQKNTCIYHGCISEEGEDLSKLIPAYSEKESTIMSNAKDKKVHLPQKCLRPFDYHINGYHPESKKYRKKFKYNKKGNFNYESPHGLENVDYNDIVFEKIFTAAFNCMVEKHTKKQGVAKKWNYINEEVDKHKEKSRKYEDYKRQKEAYDRAYEQYKRDKEHRKQKKKEGIKLPKPRKPKKPKKVKDPGELKFEKEELVDENIIDHVDAYITQCIKDEDDEENEDLAVKPIKIKKDHYTKWNFDIMVELAKRNQNYPGIQEFVYPFFRFDINRSPEVRRNTYYLPWGDGLLNLDQGLGEGEMLKEIKSFNNNYTLFVDDVGRIGIKSGNTVTKWLSQRTAMGGRRGSYVLLLSGEGFLKVLGIVSVDRGMGVYEESYKEFNKISVATKIFNRPLSLLMHNNGEMKVYENGMRPVGSSNELKTQQKVDPNDITIDNVDVKVPEIMFGKGDFSFDSDNKLPNSERGLFGSVLDYMDGVFGDLEYENRAKDGDYKYMYKEDIRTRFDRLHRRFLSS